MARTTIPIRVEMTAATVQGRTRAERQRAGAMPGVQRDIMRKTRNVAKVARATCPVRTGKARATIRAEKTTVAGLPAGQVAFGGRGVPYANIIIRGSAPHPIVARRARYLQFYWQKKQEWFVGASVNHPGTKPNPFLVRALRVAAY